MAFLSAVVLLSLPFALIQAFRVGSQGREFAFFFQVCSIFAACAFVGVVLSGFASELSSLARSTDSFLAYFFFLLVLVLMFQKAWNLIAYLHLLAYQLGCRCRS